MFSWVFNFVLKIQDAITKNVYFSLRLRKMFFFTCFTQHRGLLSEVSDITFAGNGLRSVSSSGLDKIKINARRRKTEMPRAPTRGKIANYPRSVTWQTKPLLKLTDRTVTG